VFFNKLIPALSMKGEAFYKARRDLNQEILKYIGTTQRLDTLNLRQKWLLYGRAIWDIPFPGAILYGYVASEPSYVEICNKEVKRFKNRGIRAGVGNFKDDFFVPPSGISIEEIKLAWKTAQDDRLDAGTYNGNHWFFAMSSKDDLWFLVKNPHKPLPWNTPFFLIGFVILSCSFGGLIVYKLSEGKYSFPIRIRLPVLFCFVVLAPTLSAFILGIASILDQSEVIRDFTKKQGLERIRALESGFSDERLSVLSFAQTLRNFKGCLSLNLNQVALEVESAVRSGIIERMELRDGAGQVIFTTDDPQVHGSYKAMNHLARKSIQRHAPARMAKGGKEVQLEDVVSDDFLAIDEMGVSTILQKPGRLINLQMAHSPAMIFWDVYPELATGPAFFCIVQQRDTATANYLRKKFEDVAPEGLSGLLVYDSNKEVLLSNLSKPQTRELMGIAIRAYRTGGINFREFLLNQKPYWVTAKTEDLVSDYVVMSIAPVNKSLETLGPLWMRLILGVILAIIVAGLASYLLSGLFLTPIHDLMEGIRALIFRHFEHQIPFRRPDEFGTLAVAFNKMIGEMREQEIAKVVQESLLPDVISFPNGYSVARFAQTASQLGGDYHDVTHLPNGEISIMLGDVTGHGVAAALAVAMAKATVSSFQDQPDMFPKEILLRMNSMFYEELRPRRKFMTCLCAVLDPVKNVFRIENSGQNFPAHFNFEKKAVTEVEMISFPLGVKEKLKKADALVEMNPGDVMVFYSDGYVECPGEDGTIIGYTAMEETILHSASNAKLAQDILDMLIGNFRKHAGKIPPNDDITLLIVRRQNNT
ncbi:SpoIIE family protein phosphatase, partial [bacterium]|nr:SpoIIE family protein phosphatase [bacterium]